MNAQHIQNRKVSRVRRLQRRIKDLAPESERKVQRLQGLQYELNKAGIKV